MVASIGVVASPSLGVSYYQRDGRYATDDPVHLETSAWAGKRAPRPWASPARSIPARSRRSLKGKVPGGPRLGGRGKDREIEHRPDRDVTMSAPKSVSLVALIGRDERIVKAHDRAVNTTLGWIEENSTLTRMHDATTGTIVHASGQKTVVATFRHATAFAKGSEITRSLLFHVSMGPLQSRGSTLDEFLLLVRLWRVGGQTFDGISFPFIDAIDELHLGDEVSELTEAP